MNNEDASPDINGDDIAKQIDHARSRRHHLQTSGIFATVTTEQDNQSLVTTITRQYNPPHYNVDLSARLTTSHTRSHETLDVLATMYHHENVGNVEPAQYGHDEFNSAGYLREKQRVLSKHIQDEHLRLLEERDTKSQLTRRTLTLYQDSIGKLAMTDRELQNRGYESRLERDLPDKTSIAYTNQYPDVESADRAIDDIQRLDIMQP